MVQIHAATQTGGRVMIFIIIAMCALGALEVCVYNENRYPEDLILMVSAFGVAMFMIAMLLNGVGA